LLLFSKSPFGKFYSKFLSNYKQKIKENKDSNEDTKFSFVVFKRGKRQKSSTSLESQSHHWSKIVFPPMKKNKHVILDVCTPEGTIKRSNIPKAKGITYTHARKSYWGDMWPHS
jgi:ribosomal protein RSM22 (predicted rRNA methylase)